jgi:hypothetical protein
MSRDSQHLTNFTSTRLLFTRHQLSQLCNCDWARGDTIVSTLHRSTPTQTVNVSLQVASNRRLRARTLTKAAFTRPSSAIRALKLPATKQHGHSR